MNKLLYLFPFIFVLNACSGSNGGGVTNESPAPSNSSSSSSSASSSSSSYLPVLNVALSTIAITDNSGNVLNSVAPLNQTFNLVLTAKDQNGNVLTGISSSLLMGVQNLTGYIDLVPTESSPGVYSVPLNINTQGFFTGYVKYNGLIQYYLNDYFNTSYCSLPADPAQSPFHSLVNYNAQNYYLICSVNELLAASIQSTSLSKNLLLGANLDLSSFYNYSDASNTVPSKTNIPLNQFSFGSLTNPFVGNFNGGGFTISNFVNIQNSDNVGLFDAIGDGASISNLSITNSTLIGVNNVGPIGLIQNLSTTKNVNVSQIYSIYNTVLGTSSVGNVVGAVNSPNGQTVISQNSSTLILNLSQLSSSISKFGALVGSNLGGTLINNVVTFTLNFTDKSNQISQFGALAGVDTAQGSSYIANNVVNSNLTFNRGDQIGCLIGYANGSNVQSSSQGLCALTETGSALGDITYSGGLIGKANNSSISNINANITAIDINNTFGGLIGTSNTSSYQNIYIEGSMKVLSSNIGGLVGQSENSSYKNVRSYASILTVGSPNSIGGIIGSSSNDSINIAENQGVINGSSGAEIIGGIIGYATNTVSVQNSFNSAQLKGLSTIGGLIGESNASNSTISITNSYSSGALLGNSLVGGLVGNLSGVSLTLTNNFVLSSISNLLNTALPVSYGSIVANNANSSASISNNYFLSSSTGTILACGGNHCSGTDTATSAGLSTDISYYYNLSNAPLNLWSSSIWITNLGLPSLQ